MGQASFESPTKIHPWALTGGGGWSLSGCQRCSVELNNEGAAWELEVNFCEGLFQSATQQLLCLSGQQFYRLLGLSPLLASSFHHWKERTKPGQNNSADAKGMDELLA